MERGSDKHGRRLDEAMGAEVSGLLSSGHQTHAEEWKLAEPSGEDQPDVDLVPNTALHGGVPDGMTEDDIETRSQLAASLGKDVWPAVSQVLLDKAQEQNAPDSVLAMLRRLPAGREYVNLADVWTTLRGHVETHRF